MAHLVELIDTDAYNEGQLDGGGLRLPTKSEKELSESSLRLHLLDKDQAFDIVNRWAEFARDKVEFDLSGPELSFIRCVRASR
jgi:hypothetical protein